MGESGALAGDNVDPLELFARTGDGMVAVGPEARILSWNRAATELLEYEETEVLGRPCFEVLTWHDRYGNPVCSSVCPACYRVGPDELVKTREVVAHSKSGKAVWLSVSTVLPPPAVGERYRLVHFFREVSLPPELERIVAERLQGQGAPDGEGAAVLERLTRREREVLGLLADGADTHEIAAQLVVSLTTVRNHIQNILAKLGVHSRVEAVALFLRHGG